MSESENPTTATSDDTRVAGVTDGAYALVVADFADTESAWSAYEDLKAVEDGATVAIEGVVVVKRGQDGKLDIQKATDHSTRSGLRWGVIGGIALGVIFPPSILGSAAALGAAGAGVGKVRQRHHRSELADELEDSIAPGHSGIIALVSDPGCRGDPGRLSPRPTRSSRERSSAPLPRSRRQFHLVRSPRALPVDGC